jgi:hypothetical protein
VRAALLALVLSACGGATSTSVSFDVERPTTTPDGRDIDDASPTVTLVAGARRLVGGTAMGVCTTPARASPMVRETCDEAPRGTVASLACGDDPHVDEIACFYAVREADAVELWRRDATFDLSDDAPTKVTRRPLARIGSLPLGRDVRVVAH